jgi:hypothetical protein
LHSQTDLLSRSCTYLSTAKIQLASNPLKPEELGKVAEQKKFLAALSGYAKALSQAADPAGLAKLRTAAAGFSTSAGKLAAASPLGPASAPIAGHVIKFAVNSVVNLSEIERQKQIREIAASVHDQIVDGAFLILNDEDEIRRTLIIAMKRWERHAECVLAQVRRTHKSEAHEMFVQLSRARMAYTARLKTLGKSVSLMARVIQTHKAVVDGSADLAVVLAEFDAFVAEIKALRAVWAN